MTPEKLLKISKLIYGERWQTSLAHDLDVTDRTVRRWAKEGSPVWADSKIYEFGQETISSLRDILSKK